MKISRYLLTLAFGVAVFGAVACSDDSSSSAAADDGKKDAATWDDLQVFDAKADLPSCDKFDGVAQVVDEKAFFACVEGEWEQINVSAPAYEQLPECTAPLNDFCIDISNGDEIQQSYVCDEGEWVKGVDGSCLKGDENSIESGKVEFLNTCVGVEVGERRGLFTTNCIVYYSEKICKVSDNKLGRSGMCLIKGSWENGICKVSVEDYMGFCEKRM